MFTYNCVYSIYLLILTVHSLEANKRDSLLFLKLLEGRNESHSSRNSASIEPPQYMLDLYNKISDSGGTQNASLPHGASLVRAVPVQETNHNQFTFSLESIPSEESILEAEFHVYVHQLHQEQKDIIRNQNIFRIMLLVEGMNYQLLSTEVSTVGVHFRGWRMFSVGAVVKRAVLSQRQVTFKVEARTVEGELLTVKFHRGHHHPTNPLLILFNKVNNSTTYDRLSFQKLHFPKGRNAVLTSRRSKRSIRKPTASTQMIPTGCELRHLEVDFDKIGWSWVVYPKVYDAFNCVGKCEFPIGQDLSPTNHATVVSVVHELSETPDEIEYPSCVPTSYKNLAILYYGVDDTVILKQFDRMVATNCGCR